MASTFYVRSHFKEGDSVVASVKQLTSCNTESTDAIKDKIFDNVILILKQYQEQPGLLDSHLEEIVHTLLNGLSEALPRLRRLRIEKEQEATRRNVPGCSVPNDNCTSSQLDDELITTIWYMSSIIYTVCMVRGPKSAVTVFLTDVDLLEPVLESIEDLVDVQCHHTCNGLPVLSSAYYDVLRVDSSYKPPACLLRFEDPSHWKFLYSLVMWLSLLILAPFELVDFGTQKFLINPDCPDTVERTIPQRVLVVAQKCLSYPDTIQQATSLLISKLFSRPDSYNHSVPIEFLDWCSLQYKSLINPGFHSTESVWRLGCLRAVKSILKVVGRHDLEQVLPMINVLLLKSIPESVDLVSYSTSALVKKLHTASIGRLALRYLPSNLASWRCVRGIKKLQALNTNDSPKDEVLVSRIDDVEVSEEASKFLEFIFDLLLQQLECPTITVRWAAAKSLGRITEHLPFEYEEQIVESIFDLIENKEDENSLNGACLALAELTRRGCILPSRLTRLIPALCRVSQHETGGVNRLGPAIRDAACFVCWAVARAFNVATLEPYVQQLTEALLTIALFDREINCRRAAAAAIQEHVGRQGLFPHGISIVTIADYFNLATVRSSYLCAAPKIAHFDEYRPTLLRCLVDSKLRHTERSIRELSAKSLEIIACQCLTSELIPVLIELKNRVHVATDVVDRHGALLGVSAIINCLSNRTIHQGEIEESCLTSLRNIIPQVEKNRQYRGRGGELTREACCRLIASISNATSWIPFKQNTVVRYYQSLLEGLRNFSDHVQLTSAEALHFLALNRASSVQINNWGDDLLKALANPSENIASRRGLTLGLGVIPWSRGTINKATEVLKFFCTEATSKCPNGNKELNDPQTRQSAVIAIPFLVRHLRQLIEGKPNNKTGLGEAFKTEESSAVNTGHNDLGSTPDPGTVDTSTELLNSKELSGIHFVPIESVCECLEIASLDDQYDRRGDVGSWVREAAIEVIAYLLETIPAESNSVCSNHIKPFHSDKHDRTTLSSCQVIKLFNCILRQCADKFDRTRGKAGFLAYRLLNHAVVPRPISEQIYNELHLQNGISITPDSDSPLSLISDASSKGKSEQKYPQPMQPEWIFRRAYYSYSYEIKCGKVTRVSASNIEEYRMNSVDKESDILHTPALRCIPNLIELTEIFNSIIDSDIGTFELSDKGLGTQSCLAPEPEDETKKNEIDHPDDEESDTAEDPNMGKFISWETYHYTVQRFQKAGITLKIPQFTRADCVFPYLVKILEYPSYRHSILAGVVNAIGVTLASVSRSASSALTSLLRLKRQAPKHETSDIPSKEDYSLEMWITDTLATIGVEISKTSSKKCGIVSSSTNILEYYGGVGLASILKACAILFQQELGDLMKVEPLFQSVKECVSKSSDLATLRAALDLCCAIGTYEDSNSCLFTKCLILRNEALQCAVNALCHQYPVTRQHASEQLFARLVALTDEQLVSLVGHPLNCDLADILDVLLETRWSMLERDELKEAVNQIVKGFSFETV